MILNFTEIVQAFIGSSLTFSAQGGRGKEKYNAAKIFRRRSEGAAERGCGGEFRRARAGSEAPPPARSEQKPAKKFSVPFRRKKWSRANQKCRENFFAGWRASASGGGAERLVSVRNFG